MQKQKALAKIEQVCYFKKEPEYSKAQKESFNKV